MKRYLHAGEGYAFTRNRIRYFFPVLFFLLSSCSAFRPAQSFNFSMPVHEGIFKIGDKVPRDFVIGYEPNDSTKILRLSDFKGKAVVLDAWATWCGSCISKFPLMDSLQKQYGQDLEIILVNVQGRDTPDAVRNFLDNYTQKNQDFNLSVVIETSPLNRYFSFRGLPHYIWIDGNRRVRAFTNYDSFTDENIQRLIAGLPIYIPMKIR